MAPCTPMAATFTWRVRRDGARAARRWRWGVAMALVLGVRWAFVGPTTCEREGVVRRSKAEGAPEPASLEAGTLEVIGENTSAAVRLLYSPGVQSLLALLSKLQTTSDGSGTCLQSLLQNIPKVLENVSEQEIPSDVESDFEDALQELANTFNLTENIDLDNTEIKVEATVLQRLSRLRLVQRIPEMAERMAPFEVFFPASLAEKSAVPQTELLQALRAAAKDVQEAQPSTWSTGAFEEAAELVERNPVIKEVGEALTKNIEESIADFYGTTTAAAFGFLLFQLLFLGLLFAACCGPFQGGGPTAPTGDPNLPLYTLGGTFGG
ncbi:unnamed protein product [Durusdinium trenchii]|uniref:Uncharacterized protein n=2 Tax=Durusdinium trenchii TaxID=1381693 RepID=A0ABP0MDX7_9DINO